MIKSSSIDYMLRQQEEEWERMRREQERMQEEQARRDEEAQAAAREAEAEAQARTQEGIERANEAAEAGAAESRAAAKKAHSSSIKEEKVSAEEHKPKEPVVEDGKVRIGPTNRPFTEEQSFLLHQREAVRNTKTRIVERGELGDLGEFEEHREFLEEQNKKGNLMPSAMHDWGRNQIDINFGSIKDNDQAAYFATTLDTLNDQLRFFKEYSERTKQDYQAVLAYADDKLGKRLFSEPQSNAGKRNLMYDAIDKIGLFDINGDDVNIGTADFDTVVQALSNIADEGKAKKAAAYVESLTKIPGSPYYGMTFDKDAVAYRDSANLPSKIYKDEVEALSGSFYLGEDAIDSNLAAYAEKYEDFQEAYGGDQYALRQMKSALRDAYEKQTGYVAPEDSKVEAVIEETKAERALLAQEEAEKNKSGWDKFKDAVHGFFSGEKKEEEAEVAPVEVSDVSEQPYAMRSGYIASAGPMSSGLLAENNYIKDTVEAAAPQAEAPVEAEELPEMQGPAYQPKPSDTVEVSQTQPPMSYMQAMVAHSRGEDLSPENKALIADSVKNDDFMRYVVDGTMPDPKQIMQERAYGGTMLSDAQARVRANQTTTGRQILGTQLGAVAEALGTGAMPEDVVGAGYQLMVDVMNGVGRQIRSGRIAVPAGENKYDYVIANTPHLKKKAEQLSALQKDVEGIMATRAIEAAHDYDKKVEDAEIRYLKGIETQEDLMMLHSRANTNADINDDETRMQFLHQLSGRSMWYQDDGAFWKGDSAAAQAGMRLRETRADGQYGDFKSALWDKAHDVIDELTYIAMDHGMTLGGWMEKVGLNIDDPSDIMDMAYNRIEAEGAKIAGDQEAQDAANALANVQTQGVGWMGARWGGFKHGLADDAYHFMNAGYLLMDEATYDARRNEIYNECVSEYGIELAPKVRRQILTAYAKSGVMGEEKSQELLEDIERCDSIWDIPVDVDPGMIEGLYLTGLNKIDKYVEELESVRAYLPENEAKAWDRYFVLGTNTGSGVRQRVTQLGAMALGVPYSVAKNLGLVVGYGFNTISQGTEKYESAGLPRSVAMQMGAAEAFGMIVVNALGEDTVMSSLNGRSLMRNGMETAYRKGTWIGLAKEAAKKTLASAGTEAVQEVLEEGTSKTVEMFVPTAKALSNGEQVSFSKSLQMAWDEFKGMDGKELYKDLLQAGWGGAVFGGFYAAVGMAFETPRSVANAKLQKQYPSIDIASQIAHGEIPANKENMGRFIDLMREDVQKPEFRALMDKKNDSAEQASYVTVAAVLGEGKEFRDNALKLTQTANQYDQKAEAAEKAVEMNRSQFYTARKAAMDGNQGAAVTMEGFRTAWAKAQTTATENRQAAQKKREEAAEQTGRWIYACRKLGDNMHSLTKVRASNLLMYKEQEAQADEMEPQLAEAEANVEAMGVEAFIEQNYNNASDADKDHIREIWGVPVNTKKEAEPEAATVSETENVAEETTEAAPSAKTEGDAATAPQTPSEAIAEPVVQTTAEPAAEHVQSAQPATAAPEAPAKPMQTMTGEQRLEVNRKRQLDSATKFVGQVGRRFNVKTEIAPADDKRLVLPKLGKDGKPTYASALYNRETDTIIVSENASQGDILRAKVVHELTHRTENTEAYKEFSKAVQAAYFKGNENNKTSFENNIRRLYASNGVNLSPEGLEHEVVSRITEELIGGNQEMVDRLVADSPSVARRIMDAIKTVLDKLRGVKGADVDQLRAVEKMFQKALDEAATQKRPFSSDNIQYSLREKEPPKNVVYAYKAFYARDGKLYPPMVANITDEADKQKVKGATSGTMKSLPTPVGVWLDADIGGIMTDESGAPIRSKDTKRLRVKNDKSGGGATLAFRPGWHLGEWPDAKQFNKADPETGERGKRMPDDLVFAKCEVSADVDYQLDALSYGLNNKGGFSRSQAGLPYVPDDGYYKYRTNVDPTTAPWLIAGSIKVVEILDDADCARICAEFGVTPDQRYSGKPIDLSEYGLKRGPVEATTEGMEQFKENDANRANKKLLENALNDPEYADAYVQREIDFDNPKQYEQLQKEFAMNGQDIEAYRKKYETEGFASKKRDNIQFSINDDEYMQALKSGDEDAAWERLEEEMAINSISWPYKAYRNAPDSLMGFGRKQKGYNENNYKSVVTVAIKFPGEEKYEIDTIKGTNVPHAMERARRNWYDAEEIRYVSDEEEPLVKYNNGEIIPPSQRFGWRAVGIDRDKDNPASIDYYKRVPYNRYGWVRVNNVISAEEKTKHDSRLVEADWKPEEINADGRYVAAIRDKDGIYNCLIVSDGDPVSPEIERVHRINLKNNTLAEDVEEAIRNAERDAGRRSVGSLLEPWVKAGLVTTYEASLFPTYDDWRRNGADRGNDRRSDGTFENEQNGREGEQQNGRDREGVWDDSVSLSIDEPSTLPDDDYLRAEIDEWKRSGASYSVDPQADTGKRQFANQTIQNNQYIPDYIKEAFLNDPAKSNYSRESNMRQLNAAWNRVQAEGYEAARDRLVNQETKFEPEDNADALVLMRQALHDGDLDTLMAVATKYNTEGTDQAKALQIRSLMRKMTPTGFAQTVIQDVSRKIEDRETKRPGEKRRRERESKKTKEDLNLGSLDDTSASEKLERGESVEIDSKAGTYLNDAKRALIKEFGLEKTTRPGDFYNWATTKQRMLEDILTTDDIWAKDSNGMDLVDRLVRMKHGEPVLTKADLAYITEQMGIFDRLADKNSREADLALARAHEAQGNINGATGRMKRRTWRYVSMLLSVPSAIRNVIGNTAQSLPNSFADGIAVSLDQAISFVFGTERTRAHLSAKERIEGWDAFRNEVFNTFRDYFVDKAITQYGEGRYNQSQIGRVYQTQSLETLRHLEGLLMSVGDRTFWKKKFLNSMAEQQHLAEINGTAFDVEAAMEIAEAEANYATFNEDSTVRNLMSSLTEHIPFLDYLMPFVGVPTNIIKRQIEFSPIGIASTAIRHGWAAVRGESFDQRAFVDGMARGLTGSAMMGLGVLLLKSGFLKLGTKEEDDDKSYGVRTAQGDQYGVYFTIGDKNYSITTFSPAASALVAGAFFADAMGDNERWTQALINATLKNINEIFDASYMSSLADALNTSNGKTFTENLIPAIGSAMISQNIPAPLTHLATSLDPYVRDTKDKDAMMEILNTTLNKIPGARQLLPKKVDVAGRAVENTKQGIAAFVDPFTTSKAVGDPALDEMIRLRDVLEADGAKEPRAHMASDALSGRRNTLTQNSMSYTVTPEEKVKYRERYGDLWRNGGRTYDKKGRSVSITQGVEELIRSRSYQLMDDYERAEAIKEILQKAKTGATYEIMNHK